LNVTIALALPFVAVSKTMSSSGSGSGKTWVKMILRELDDSDVMSELNPRSLSVAEQQCERTFEHSLIRDLVDGFGIDGQILASGGQFVPRIRQELLHLFRINVLWLRSAHDR
jgi:hypothetical protein